MKAGSGSAFAKASAVAEEAMADEAADKERKESGKRRLACTSKRTSTEGKLWTGGCVLVHVLLHEDLLRCDMEGGGEPTFNRNGRGGDRARERRTMSDER